MTITQVAKQYELTQDTLRYYERIGLIPAVPRNKNGIRNYAEESCNWIEFIKCMRSAGLSIEALVEYVDLFQKGESTLKARKEILITQRQILAKKVEQMSQTVERLDRKIETYEQNVVGKEKQLTKGKEE